MNVTAKDLRKLVSLRKNTEAKKIYCKIEAACIHAACNHKTKTKLTLTYPFSFVPGEDPVVTSKQLDEIVLEIVKQGINLKYSRDQDRNVDYIRLYLSWEQEV